MKNKKKIRKSIIVVLVCITTITLTGCGWLSNKVKDIKGELVGNSFNIEFFDNFGNEVLEINGKKVGLEANYTETSSISQDGEKTTNYELTSVVTLTVDGNQIDQTGNTIIFAEKGLKRLTDFSLPDNISTSGGTINIFDRNINKIKNILGTEKIVIISSQLGVPLAVYGGDKVYWEIPDDLPKMTKLNIDKKALYIHRANYIIIDSNMIK